MARFTTRVELHDADEDDYQTLHEEMQKLFFYRIIVDDNTKEKFHLPPAEYNSTANLNKEEVLNLAIKAANVTGKESSILVTESNGRIWHNLKLVK